jgi:hypothetical protein
MTFATHVQRGHESGPCLRAATDLNLQAKAAMEASQCRRPDFNDVDGRIPHQRSVGEYPQVSSQPPRSALLRVASRSSWCAASCPGPPVVAVALSRPGEAAQQRANVLALMTAVSLSSILASILLLLYYGLFTRQTVIIGLALIPFYSAATALGAGYFALAGQRYYRRAALATLAAIGMATLIASLRNYLKG